MKTDDSVNVQVGGGWVIPVFLVFLILKLTNTVDWSWWIVTLPLWLGPAFVTAIVVAVFVAALIVMCCAGVFLVVASVADGITDWQRERRRKARLK